MNLVNRYELQVLVPKHVNVSRKLLLVSVGHNSVCNVINSHTEVCGFCWTAK